MAVGQPFTALSPAAESMVEALLDGWDANTLTLLARWKIQVGTSAEINALTLASGELAFTSDTRQFRVGDGTTAGGLSVGLSSESAVTIQPTGNAAANGALLVAAYALAKTLTPGGNALAADNRAAVHVIGGVWSWTATGDGVLTLDAQYVDLIGIAQPILYAGTLRFSADNIRWSGFQALAGFAIQINTADNTGWVFEDLLFTGGTGNLCTWTVGTALGGTYRNIRSTRGRTFGGSNGMTVTAAFENCRGTGTASWGSGVSAATTSPALFGGTYRNCKIRCSTHAVALTAGALVEHTEIQVTGGNVAALQIKGDAAGIVVKYSTLVPSGSAKPIANYNGEVEGVGGITDVKAAWYQCAMTVAVDAVTNRVDTPNNTIDTDVSVPAFTVSA